MKKGGSKHDNKIREFLVTSNQVADIMHEKQTPDAWHLPNDAELVYFKLNDDGSYVMRVRSEEYDPVPFKQLKSIQPEDLRGVA